MVPIDGSGVSLKTLDSSYLLTVVAVYEFNESVSKQPSTYNITIYCISYLYFLIHMHR